VQVLAVGAEGRTPAGKAAEEDADCVHERDRQYPKGCHRCNDPVGVLAQVDDKPGQAKPKEHASCITHEDQCSWPTRKSEVVGQKPKRHARQGQQQRTVGLCAANEGQRPQD
jgi:hypothetical protein